MKASLALCLVFAVVGLHAVELVSFPKEVADPLRAIVRECAGDDATAEEYMKLVSAGKYGDDDKFKSFLFCSYKKGGYVSDDGRINADAAASVYPDVPKAFAAIKSCDKDVGGSPTETLYEYFKCFQQTSPYHIGL